MERETNDHFTIMCPTCKRMTEAQVINRVEAHEKARPRIPARIVLLCSHQDCKTPWYIVDREAEGNANSHREEDHSAEADSEPRGSDCPASD